MLIEVAAAGVNRPDVMQRSASTRRRRARPTFPASKWPGTSPRSGDGVTAWSIGDAGLRAGGRRRLRRTLAAAPQEQCLPIPTGLTLIEAAAIPETFFTVWTNVFERGRLKAGETILIHGGTSGIGTTAIQLASAFGARVLATAGSEEKCEAARKLGADCGVQLPNRRTGSAAAKDATDGRGVDVVLDMVGGDYIPRNLELLAVEGRLVQIAFLKSPKAELDFSVMMRKRAWITGSTLRPRSPAEKGAIARELAQHVWPLLERARSRPSFTRSFRSPRPRRRTG